MGGGVFFNHEGHEESRRYHFVTFVLFVVKEGSHFFGLRFLRELRSEIL